MSNKPLFSRRQLNLIILVSAALIALLSLPRDNWPTLKQQTLPGTGLLLYSSPQGVSQLRLLFKLPQPRLLPPEAAQILAALLDKRLQATPALIDADLRLHADRMTLQLNQPTPEKLGLLLRALSQPLPDQQLDEQLKRQRAQQHLAGERLTQLQQTDRWLNGQDHSLENGDDSVHRLHLQLINPRHLTLSLTGPLSKPLFNQLDSQFALLAEPLDLSSLPRQEFTSQTSNSTLGSNLLAPLQQLPGRRDPDFATMRLLQRLLRELQPDNNGTQLITGQSHSWRVWFDSATALPMQLNLLQQQLAQQPDWELEQRADQLREQLQQRLQHPDALAELVETVAFYQLPLDYPARFDATIAALDGAQLRRLLQHQLSLDSFVSSTITSTATNETTHAAPNPPNPQTH